MKKCHSFCHNKKKKKSKNVITNIMAQWNTAYGCSTKFYQEKDF